MKPLRVLTIGHSYVVRVNRGIAAAVARRPGIELTVAAPAFFHGDLRPLALERDDEPAGYDLRPVRARLTRFIQLFGYSERELFRLVRSGNFDVVHAWEEPYIFAGHQIARAVGPTRARFCFRTAQNIVKRYPPPFSLFEKGTFRRAQGWIAGGSLVRKAMIEKGLPADKGRVITLGVDAGEFRPAVEAERARVLDTLGLEPPVVGFVGRLVPAKGIDVLLRAMEKVKERASYLFLGSGPLRAEIERWAEARGMRDRVRVLLAPHGEMPRYLGALDMLVAPSQTTPSWSEQFGRMVIEAFACRVAVVGSDSGEIPHVLGDAGRVVPEADADAWARTIDELLASPELRRELAERGHARFLERYSAERVAAQYAEFYEELAAAPLA